MHFSIPDTSDCSDENGSNYTVFNVHINGVYHCSVRYKQFHSFHEQLKREYGSGVSLPTFPPKKLLSLTPSQLEERRSVLEKYLQTISQSPNIASSSLFNGFLLSAQQESQQEEAENVRLDTYLMNGHKITISILSTDQTDTVLETVASQVELPSDYVYYFGLFLIRKESGSENTIVRKLQEFESPYISLKAANRSGTHRIVVRKSYWDASYDDELMSDRVAMNLLYIQAVSDIERGWVNASKEQHKQLIALQQKGSKKEYLRLARTLKFYSFLQFKPCSVDYPQPNSKAVISAGNRELHFRIETGSKGEVKEVAFKVTRMRCWRISTMFAESNGEVSSSQTPSTPTSLELAFEYLVAKDSLKWITVYSDQAILMSMCLQGMVDELIMKKDGRRIKKPSDRSSNGYSNQRSDNHIPHSSSSDADSPSSILPQSSLSLPSPSHRDTIRNISERIAKKNAPSAKTQNDMFLESGIGDDDL